MELTTITVNVKNILPGDVIKPNGSGPARVVAEVTREGNDVTIHFVGGGSRWEHHTKRRTVRRPA